MIQRNITRTILNSTETTQQTASVTSDHVDFNLQTTDFFYVGFQGPFAARYFDLQTANNVTASLTVEYWDGSAWVDVQDLVDQTNCFKNNGFVSWVNDGKWQPSIQAPVDVKLYWVRMSVSANLTNGAKLQSCVNVFSDDDLLNAYYPELQSDSRFKPVDVDGSPLTTFLKQHLAAKDLVVLRLKQRKVITEESQLVDVSAVAIAAVHGAAWLIVNPIATSDEMKALAERAKKLFDMEINELGKSADIDGDGVVTESEAANITETVLVRR
jgi:hypothetical protein